jgi:hypothetical protein
VAVYLGPSPSCACGVLPAVRSARPLVHAPPCPSSRCAAAPSVPVPPGSSLPSTRPRPRGGGGEAAGAGVRVIAAARVAAVAAAGAGAAPLVSLPLARLRTPPLRPALLRAARRVPVLARGRARSRGASNCDRQRRESGALHCRPPIPIAPRPAAEQETHGPEGLRRGRNAPWARAAASTAGRLAIRTLAAALVRPVADAEAPLTGGCPRRAALLPLPRKDLAEGLPLLTREQDSPSGFALRSARSALTWCCHAPVHSIKGQSAGAVSKQFQLSCFYMDCAAPIDLP